MNEHNPELHVDRSAFSVASSFSEAQALDEAYWRALSPAERAARLQLMRRIAPRFSPDEPS